MSLRKSLETVDDVVLLSLLVWGEARGEPVEGQIAVAYVVRNRVRKGLRSWKQVMLQPYQFSCFNEGDPNLSKIVELIGSPNRGGLVLQQCYWVAQGVFEDMLLDNTGGATHYMTKSLYDSPQRPSWARNMKVTKIIGRHVFLC